MMQQEYNIVISDTSCLILLSKIEESVLIIDDLKGRKYAGKLGLKFSGTLGLILKAKQLEVITSIKPLVIKIRKTNFRFSNALLQSILEEADES